MGGQKRHFKLSKMSESKRMMIAFDGGLTTHKAAPPYSLLVPVLSWEHGIVSRRNQR